MRKAAVENSEGGYNALELNSFIYDEEEKAILDNQTEFAWWMDYIMNKNTKALKKS